MILKKIYTIFFSVIPFSCVTFLLDLLLFLFILLVVLEKKTQLFLKFVEFFSLRYHFSVGSKLLLRICFRSETDFLIS